MFSLTHHDDLVQSFTFSNYWVNYFMQLAPERKPHARPTIYVRILDTYKKYRWVMVQYINSLINDEGYILFGLTLVTDISHIKKEGPALMSILDTYDDSCYQFLCVDGKSLTDTDKTLPKLSNGSWKYCTS